VVDINFIHLTDNQLLYKNFSDVSFSIIALTSPELLATINGISRREKSFKLGD